MVSLLRDLGLTADRVPLSGSAGGDFAGDIKVDIPLVGVCRAEVKARKDGAGWQTIEKWLGENDLLILQKDRSLPLVVLPWQTFREMALLGGAVDADEGTESDPAADPEKGKV